MFPLEQSEGLVSLLSMLGFFSNTVICGRGPQPQITGSGSVGLVCRGNGLWGAVLELLQWKPHGFRWATSGWSNQHQDDIS